jgi:hypothetical protein
MMVMDVFDGEGIYFHKDLWSEDPASIRHGRFRSFGPSLYEKFREATPPTCSSDSHTTSYQMRDLGENAPTVHSSHTVSR